MTERKGNDWYNKIICIPCWNKFIGAKRDSQILKKLIGDEQKSYLLNLALSGLKRLIDQNGFTISKAVEKALWQYKCANDSVLRWVSSTNKTKINFENAIVADLWEEYKNWISSAQSGVHRSRNSFLSTIKTTFALIPIIENGKEIFK
jgi:putative DNA primase/helicase